MNQKNDKSLEGASDAARGNIVELWLIRHGQTVENANGILSGWIEARLSEKGIAQAKALAPVLAGVHFDSVSASPLRRARDTARYAGKPDPVVQEAIKEFCFGDYDGLSIDELPRPWMDSLYAFGDFVPPHGETVEMVKKRVTAFLDTLPAGRHLLFCHGGVIRSVVRHLGVDKFLENGTILVIDWTNKKIIRHIVPQVEF